MDSTAESSSSASLRNDRWTFPTYKPARYYCSSCFKFSLLNLPDLAVDTNQEFTLFKGECNSFLTRIPQLPTGIDVKRHGMILGLTKALKNGLLSIPTKEEVKAKTAKMLSRPMLTLSDENVSATIFMYKCCDCEAYFMVEQDLRDAIDEVMPARQPSVTQEEVRGHMAACFRNSYKAWSVMAAEVYCFDGLMIMVGMDWHVKNTTQMRESRLWDSFKSTFVLLAKTHTIDLSSKFNQHDLARKRTADMQELRPSTGNKDRHPNLPVSLVCSIPSNVVDFATFKHNIELQARDSHAQIFIQNLDKETFDKLFDMDRNAQAWTIQLDVQYEPLDDESAHPRIDTYGAARSERHKTNAAQLPNPGSAGSSGQMDWEGTGTNGSK
ncbi:uncharacterized protein KY384_004129 [Bacidia gigantensis]|uniref:uncharacterized protein n=1 Tax=Bacidia gigantensis TaxID=2732470 RepID=UPI001D044024|nr:uncharacterized protein KY384_004129 [Bacidia gigantensis]KAG8530772.1 hypothetical protein KY384_004129 [Bacidia gigantensis]